MEDERGRLQVEVAVGGSCPETHAQTGRSGLGQSGGQAGARAGNAEVFCVLSRRPHVLC